MRRSAFASLSLAILLSACASHDAKTDAATEHAQVQKAIELRRSGNTAQAVSFLHQALEAAPNDPALLGQYGDALIEAGQPEEAVNAFDKLIALQPGNASAYDGKAVAFDHSGNHLAAQDLYQQALTLAPHSAAIRNNLGMSLILNDQLDKAIPLLEALYREDQANKTVRQNLALAYGLAGRKGKALALNLQDMSEAQAQDNLQFYEEYARRMQAHGKPAAMPVGFARTPGEMMDKSDKEESKSSKPATIAPSHGESDLAPQAGHAEDTREDTAAPAPPAGNDSVSAGFPSVRHSITY